MKRTPIRILGAALAPALCLVLLTAGARVRAEDLNIQAAADTSKVSSDKNGKQQTGETGKSSSDNEKDKANDFEERFSQQNDLLIKRISQRIAEIVGWMPTEQSGPSRLVVLAECSALKDRLKKTRDVVLSQVKSNKENIRTKFKEAASLEAEFNKRFETADTELLKHYEESEVRLAALLGKPALSPRVRLYVGFIYIAAFLFFIWGMYKFIKHASQKEGEAPEPGRLAKGTIRSAIALGLTYLMMVLALTDFLINGRIGGYLTAAFTAVITFYFGSRAIEAFYGVKPTFAFTKKHADNSEDKVEYRGSTEEAWKKLTPVIVQSLHSVAESVVKIEEREEKKMGFISGKVDFKPDLDKKDGVDVTLEGQDKCKAKTDANGFFLITDVPPGQYSLKAEKKGYETVTQKVELAPLQTLVVDPIQMKKTAS